MPWKTERLGPSHDLSAFDCGEPTLNSFLQKHALNNDRAGLGRTFVAIEPDQLQVAGYFTVSTGSVRFDSFPDYKKRRLPKYPIPTVHIGRLAVDGKSKGKGLGEALLIEALRKATIASKSIGVFAVDLIALNENAKRFYLKYGFVETLDDPMHLFLPIETVRQLAELVDD